MSTVLNFMLWLLYVYRQNTQNPLNRRLCGPLSMCGSFGGEKNLVPLQGIEAQTVQSTSYLLHWLCYHSFSVLLHKFLLLMCQCPCHFCIRSNEKCWTVVKISKQSSIIPHSSYFTVHGGHDTTLCALQCAILVCVCVMIHLYVT